MTVFIGISERDGTTVAIDDDTRRKHCAIFGKSGVGKTTLLRNMCFADLHNNVGFSVLDPHGSLIDDLLTVIPRNRARDIIYLNPAEDRVLAMNILESVRREERPLVVSSVISIFKNLWPANWGPRSEYVLENCVYALLEQPEPVTLLGLPKLLLNTSYRKEVLRHVGDPAIRQFFDFYEAQNDRLREESIAPLLNKLGKLTTNPLLRSVIGQARSSFNFRRLMDEGQVLLCSLSKGALGEDVSSLLGSLIVTKLTLASLSRQDVSESERRLHVLYADEVQNFCGGVALPTIVAESRKYALSLCLGTQTLSQLPEDSRAAVFGNCATIMSYRVSGEDAQALVREFGVSGEGPKTAEQWFDLVVPASELQSLPDYHLYVRTLIDGRPADPVRVKSFPPLNPAYVGAERLVAKQAKVIRTSLERFGRDRSRVDAEITSFLSRAATR